MLFACVQISCFLCTIAACCVCVQDEAHQIQKANLVPDHHRTRVRASSSVCSGRFQAFRPLSCTVLVLPRLEPAGMLFSSQGRGFVNSPRRAEAKQRLLQPTHPGESFYTGSLGCKYSNSLHCLGHIIDHTWMPNLKPASQYGFQRVSTGIKRPQSLKSICPFWPRPFMVVTMCQ